MQSSMPILNGMYTSSIGSIQRLPKSFKFAYGSCLFQIIYVQWGENCAEECMCNGAQCSPTTGECICAPGYQGKNNEA